MDMDGSTRVFLAIDMPPEVKALVQQIQEQLKQHDLTVRWIDPASTHLTLKFLGKVPTSSVDELVERMAEVAVKSQPLALRTDTLGVFPNLLRPRVVWLGLTGDLHALGRLQTSLEQAFMPLGFAAEGRPFTPHLTLGRTHKEVSRPRLQTIERAVAQTTIRQSVEFEVSEVVLMRSDLHPSGARYTVLAQAALGIQNQERRTENREPSIENEDGDL
jgi:2'-5' RNA ligase